MSQNVERNEKHFLFLPTNWYGLKYRNMLGQQIRDNVKLFGLQNIQTISNQYFLHLSLEKSRQILLVEKPEVKILNS